MREPQRSLCSLLRVLMVVMLLLLFQITGECRCDYSAVFNFGDSTSDTGAMHYAFPWHEHAWADHYPYGITFFGKPTGRYSDGKLSIDFLMEALGMPLLSPYLQSVGANFGHGANFAVAGATVRAVNYISPMSLAVQVNQFKLFKQKVLDFINLNGEVSYLPAENAFNNGLYIIDIGGNDISYGYQKLNLSPFQLPKKIMPIVARGIAGAIEGLYQEGARTFLVRDVGPQGCQPFWLSNFKHSKDDYDENGCSIPYNKAVRFYNVLLRAQLSRLRSYLPNSIIVYVDTYDIIYDFFANPSNYGFKNTVTACCGVGGKYNYTCSLQCGSEGKVKGQTVFATSCANPSEYVNWDGVHWTHRANELITHGIISGAYFNPSNFSLTPHCDLQPL